MLVVNERFGLVLANPLRKLGSQSFKLAGTRLCNVREFLMSLAVHDLHLGFPFNFRLVCFCQFPFFLLLKNMSYFPLVGVKGIYHYWLCCCLFPQANGRNLSLPAVLPLFPGGRFQQMAALGFP